MAYRNLINISCASTAEVFRHTLDFLTSSNGIADYSASGLGWTIYDSQFATSRDNPAADDWVVVTSAGENGKQALYYRLLFSTLANSILRTRAGLYWNASTKAWVVPMSSTDQASGPTTGAAYNLWIYGDLDRINIIVGNGTTNYGRSYGLIDTAHDATIATTTGSVSSGSNVVVPVDAVPASWSVGRAVIVRNSATIERAVIGAISGTNVTLATLANSYAAGARIARDYATLINVGANWIDTGRVQIGRSGLTTDAGQTVASNSDTTTFQAADPDQLNGDIWLADAVKVYSNTYGYYGTWPDVLECSTTGITSGQVLTDEADGASYRALLVDSKMYLFREV